MPTVLQAERLDVTTIPKGRWIKLFCRSYQSPIKLKIIAAGPKPIIDIGQTVGGPAEGFNMILIGCTDGSRVFNGEIRTGTRILVRARNGKEEQVVMDGVISRWEISTRKF